MKPANPADGLRYFVASSLVLVFSYGVAVGMFEVFPHGLIKQAIQGLSQLNGGNFVQYYHPVRNDAWPAITKTDETSDGINLITRIGSNERLVAEIIDLNGAVIHRWDIDWFALWPDAEHLPSEVKPRSAPGCQIHGAALMPNGDLVFNFDYLGLVRIDKFGSIVWRLAYQTHHSVYLHDDGNLWVCGQKRYFEDEIEFPRRRAPYDESTILEVSPDGHILNEWSVESILRDNGYGGLLGLSRGFINGYAKQDILHLNDIELFPADMAEGNFERDDILVSLRNISTIFVMDRATRKIKFISTGQMIWQHDPDFIDGNRIGVFDNKGGNQDDAQPSSRILVFEAASPPHAQGSASGGLQPPTNTGVTVAYQGTTANPFFTDIMGKHQWLPNGNVLITESTAGRAFEIDPNGAIVWQYVNYVEAGTVGLIQEVTRLPSEAKRLFVPTDGRVAQQPSSATQHEG